MSKTDWKKYPMERVIMNKEKHVKFVSKVKKIKIAKSRAINLLIDLLIDGIVGYNKEGKKFEITSVVIKK